MSDRLWRLVPKSLHRWIVDGLLFIIDRKVYKFYGWFMINLDRIHSNVTIAYWKREERDRYDTAKR